MESLRKGILRKRVFQDLKGEKPKCGMEKWQDSFVMLTEELFLAYKDANQPKAHKIISSALDEIQLRTQRMQNKLDQVYCV